MCRKAPSEWENVLWAFMDLEAADDAIDQHDMYGADAKSVWYCMGQCPGVWEM